MPGSSQRKLAKATAVGADELVLDLEDAVVAAAKDEARSLLVEAVSAASFDGRNVAVRVNALGGPWWEADLEAVAGLPAIDSVVVPKVERADDLVAVDGLLAKAEGGRRARPLRLQALIETAAGLARIGEIATATGRLETLIIGYADLASSLGRSATKAADPAVWAFVQDTVLVAARAHGLQAIDGPYFGTAVDEAFLARAADARELGFDGKWVIHPGQVDALNEVFLPLPEEVERARALLEALAAAERDGLGATTFDGEMVDEAMRSGALRVLARAGEPR